MARVWIDADTGNEIIFFYRRGRPYLYLRDRRTKRFIKRLMVIEIRVFIVVEYGIEKAKKRNPIYIDNVVITSVRPKDMEKIEEIKEDLIDKAIEIIVRYFATPIAYYSTISGIEYGSKVTKRGEYPKSFSYEIVWKHHRKEEGKREWGIETW